MTDREILLMEMEIQSMQGYQIISLKSMQTILSLRISYSKMLTPMIIAPFAIMIKNYESKIVSLKTINVSQLMVELLTIKVQ